MRISGWRSDVCSSDLSMWRNRSTFVTGRAAIVDFLTAKWAREHDYRLVKGLWGFTDNRIAVRFAYEWHDDAGQWRSEESRVGKECVRQCRSRWSPDQ